MIHLLAAVAVLCALGSAAQAAEPKKPVSARAAKAPLAKQVRLQKVPEPYRAVPQGQENSNCTIEVTYLLKTGAKDVKFHHLTAGSKAECSKAADEHKPNFTKNLVSEKRVTYFWRGRK